MEVPDLEIIDFKSEHQPWFEKFNRDWIEKYFFMEPRDVQILQHPAESIIDQGGWILMARVNREFAGTVALRYVAAGVFEFTKMAVDENFRGRKIGKALAEAAIEKAIQLGARKIILYSNTLLTTAISMYRQFGFKEVPLDGSYVRSNIKMELELTDR